MQASQMQDSLLYSRMLMQDSLTQLFGKGA